MIMREFSSQRHKIRFYHSLEGERKMEAFREMVDESGQIAFLGGAGVSTESGIPDFRSRNGLYRKADKHFSKYRPEYLLSSDCLYHTLPPTEGRGRLHDRKCSFRISERIWTVERLCRMTRTGCLLRWSRTESLQES